MPLTIKLTKSKLVLNRFWLTLLEWLQCHKRKVWPHISKIQAHKGKVCHWKFTIKHQSTTLSISLCSISSILIYSSRLATAYSAPTIIGVSFADVLRNLCISLVKYWYLFNFLRSSFSSIIIPHCYIYNPGVNHLFFLQWCHVCWLEWHGLYKLWNPT